MRTINAGRGLLLAACMCAVVEASGSAAEPAPAAGAIIWKQQFGTAQSEGISKLAVDGAGNVIAYGSTTGALSGSNKGGTDVFIAKYSPDGAQTWVRQLGTPLNDRPAGIAVSSTGDVVIAASTPSQWFLAKYNSGGTLIGQRTFTTAPPAAIALTNGGQIVAVSAAGDYLNQYSSTGALVWEQPIIDAGFSSACCITIDRSGAIIVGGRFWSIIWNVAKFSSTGTMVWSHNFGGLDGADCTGVATDANNNVIAVGRNELPNAYGFSDNFDVINKWSPAGINPISDVPEPLTMTVKTNEESRPSGVALNAAGDIFMSGSSPVYIQSGLNTVVTAFGSDGTQRWRAIYGSAGTDYANAIAVGPDGAVYVGGWTSGALGGAQKGGGDAFLLKLSPQ